MIEWEVNGAGTIPSITGFHGILSNLPGVRFDIQVFQSLRLNVGVEVLRGAPVFVRDVPFLYGKAVETIRDFDNFRHHLYDYTGQAAIS